MHIVKSGFKTGQFTSWAITPPPPPPSQFPAGNNSPRTITPGKLLPKNNHPPRTFTPPPPEKFTPRTITPCGKLPPQGQLPPEKTYYQGGLPL